MPAQGVVLAVGFDLAVPDRSDIKIDLCGHCIRCSLQQTMLLAAQAARELGLPWELSEQCGDEENVETAFIGCGASASGAPRLNLYFKGRGGAHD
jgi:hypothetical protein